MLTVIADAEDKVFKSGKREPAVLCRCDCGAETVVVKSSLKNGTTKSCGCIKNKVTSDRFSKDLTGERFGFLTAIKKAEKIESQRDILVM